MSVKVKRCTVSKLNQADQEYLNLWVNFFRIEIEFDSCDQDQQGTSNNNNRMYLYLSE